MRLLKAVTISVCLASPAILSAQPQSEALLKARILQLERQLMACSVQMTSAQQSQQQASLEKEAGCLIDMTAVPPKCKTPDPK